MKKMLSILFVVFLCTTISFGQGFRKGTNYISPGIGIGGLAGAYGDNTIAISLGAQFGIEDKISIGPIVGYSSSTEDYGGWGGNDWEWTYTYIILGARGEYHFIDNPSSPWDAYAGLTLGYNIVSFDEPDGWNGFGYDGGESYLLYGFHAGAKYFFNPNIAAYAEIGYGIGILNLGVTFKF